MKTFNTIQFHCSEHDSADQKIKDDESENYGGPDIGNSDFQLIKSFIRDYEKNAGYSGKL